MSTTGHADEEGSPTVSLIQQRMAIDRDKKTNGIWAACLAVFVVTSVIVALFSRGEWLPWFQVLLFAGLAALRVRDYAKALNAEKIFTTEHGENAGKQEPVR